MFKQKNNYFLSLYAIIKQIHPIKIASSDFEKYLYQKKQ